MNRRSKPESGAIPPAEAQDSEKFLTTKQVAARLKCSVAHARNLGTIERKLQTFKDEGGNLLFDAEEVELYAGSAELSSTITFDTLLRHADSQEGAVKQAQIFAEKLFDRALDSLRLMADENEALRKRVFQLEDRLSKNFDELETARSKNHERQLEMDLVRDERMYAPTKQMWGMLARAFELAAPDLLKRMGIEAPKVNGKSEQKKDWIGKEGISLEDLQAAAFDMLTLVGELSDTEIGALKSWLAPEQMQRLMSARVIALEIAKGKRNDPGVNSPDVGMGSATDKST